MSSLGTTITHSDKTKNTFSPDSGLDALKVKSGGVFHVGALPADIVLTFHGRVTRVPIKNALPLCEAFQEKFCLVADAGQMNHQSEMFCPAWNVATLKPQPKAKAKRKPKAKAKGKEEEEDMFFP